MKVNIIGRKVEITDKLRNITEKKIEKLSKFFKDDAEAKVTFSEQKLDKTVEVTIFQSGMIYRAEETDRDEFAAIDNVVDVIERQIRKNKTRLEKKLRETAFTAPAEIDDAEEETEFKIVKTKKYAVKPMSPDEAILQMNLLGHEFFLFKNSNTDENNIVYKRHDGNYGLIETE
ncbi:MAG: ribosome-associated translation inhibitor RaiA [Clostridia bacterium]|nr:ribosome-associated translation inhibitor RaiA [Clostridia bacterium]